MPEPRFTANPAWAIHILEGHDPFWAVVRRQGFMLYTSDGDDGEPHGIPVSWADLHHLRAALDEAERWHASKVTPDA